LYLIDAFNSGDYPSLGTYIGMITSDLFLKNPFSPSWVYQNSVILKGTQLEYKAPKYYNPSTLSKATKKWERVHKNRVVSLNELRICLEVNMQVENASGNVNKSNEL
jgi:hypothetical protein